MMLKRIVSYLRKVHLKMFTQNLGLKAIALIVAFLIWVFVTNSDDPIRTQLFTVPITMVNEDSFAAVDKVVDTVGTGVVTVKVRERRSVISRLSRTGSDFYVEADLENITEMNTVPLTITCSNTAVTWDEMEISPSSLKVTLDDKTEQTFAITVSAAGTPGSGYAIGTTEIEQGKSVIIAGPQSIIRIIGQVTAPITVGGLSRDVSLSSQLRIFDKNGSELTETQMGRLELKDGNGTLLTDRMVNVNVDMWEVRSDISVKVDTIGEPAFGYRVVKVETLPAQITLAGTEEAFAAMGRVLESGAAVSVEGASSNVTQEIDLTEVVAAVNGLKFLADADPVVSVTVTLEKSGDRILTIPISEVEMKNRPDKMKLVFTPADVLSVTVHADGEEGGADTEPRVLSASVDLSSCVEEGTYELPVEVVLSEGQALSSDVTLKVSASTSESEPQTETGEKETSGG